MTLIRRVPRATVLAASLLVASGCGQGVEPISFDSTLPTDATTTALVATSTTSTPTLSTDVTGPKARGPWVDATSNLVGLDSECGTLSFVSARPDRDALIVGVAKQGLWISENGAATWARLGRAAGSAVINNRTTSITYDPAHPNTFWESGGYGAGVFKTTDNGASFKGLGDVAHSDQVSIDLTDPNRRTLLSGTHEQPKVFRSTDGGSTWTDISAGLPANIGYASFPHVIDANTYLLGTRSGANSGVFRTADGGATWSPVHDTAAVSGPPLVAKSDGHIYWLLQRGNGLITSKDAGLTWTEVDSSGPVGQDRGTLLELPDGRFATFSENQVIISADHGASWRAVGPSLPYEPSGMTYSPSRHAFYIWHFDCDSARPNLPVIARSIMRLDVDLGTG